MKKENYTHITADERDQICALRAAGSSLREIARVLGRHHTTISRELKNNAAPVHLNYYLSHKAHERSVKRKSQAHRRDRLKNDLIRRYVEEHLSIQWTPEQIAVRLSTDLKGQTISHEAIYQYIYKERRDLVKSLPRHHKRRFKRGHSHRHRNSHIPNRVSIEERPQSVDNREQEGHWEKDCLISRESKACIDVSTERKSRFTILDLQDQRSAELSKESLVNILIAFPENWRRSITYDNGSENTLHEEVNRILGTKSYFCHAYASWEKGTVEYTNGLIRRFFPKKTDFSKLSIGQVKLVQFLLNTRPRKCLNFKTPFEVLMQSGALKR